MRRRERWYRGSGKAKRSVFFEITSFFFLQRMAIKWVNENAALFGADPNKLALVGQSAGTVFLAFVQRLNRFPLSRRRERFDSSQLAHASRRLHVPRRHLRVWPAPHEFQVLVFFVVPVFSFDGLPKQIAGILQRRAHWVGLSASSWAVLIWTTAPAFRPRTRARCCAPATESSTSPSQCRTSFSSGPPSSTASLLCRQAEFCFFCLHES